MSASIKSFHVTLHNEKSFSNGVWPLTHFGPPSMGIWQTVSKNLTEIMTRDVTLKVMEVDIRYDNMISVGDSGTSNIWGFLLEIYRAKNLVDYEELQKAKDLYCKEFNTDRTDNRSVRTKEARIFAGKLCAEYGYDLVSYENSVERDAPEILRDLPYIPHEHDNTCYINTNSEQISNFSTVAIIDKENISEIVNKMRNDSEIFRAIYEAHTR